MKHPLMKKVKRSFALVALFFFCFVAIAPACFAEDDYSFANYDADGDEVFQNFEYYDTLQYDVDVAIDENNTYFVKETIKVQFHSPRHGIFRYIPINSTMVREIGGNTEYFPTRASISKVKVNGYKFEKSKEDGNLVIQIGDPDTYVDGIQTYEITYQYRPYDDMIESYDEVYFNILPTGWPTPIDNGSFTITLPGSFSPDQAYFYCGDYGSQFQEAVDYKINGNQIKGQLNRKIPRYNGVTLRIELPQGYFTSQRNYDGGSMVMWGIILGVPVVAAILWLFFGRDSTLIKPIAVSPPESLTPADMGYLIDETPESRDMIALLFYWADKGYITIRDTANGKDFILTKLKPLPEDSAEYEFTMFDRIFRSHDDVSIKSLSGKFSTTLSTAQAQLKGQFDFKEQTRLYTVSSKRCERLVSFLSVLPTFAVAIVCYWNNMLLGIAPVFISLILAFIQLVIFDSFRAAIRMWNSRGFKQRAFHLCASGILILVISFFLATYAQNALVAQASEFAMKYYFNPQIPMLLAILSSLITLGFTTIMRKRTVQMNYWYGEILGFKEFIEYAEKERLEALVNEMPDYFYRVLPYAYVLGVSDTWAKKFEDIAIEAPVWYQSGYSHSHFNSLLFVHSMNDSFRTAQTSLSTPPPNTSSGGGFSGGGGGGGFSGGGGGGGGGGSW